MKCSVKSYIVFILLLATSLSYARTCERVMYYPSVDQHGDSLILSGRISLPTNKRPKGIILLFHYTIAANSEVPSTSRIYESHFFRDDYVLIMPDYLGYGLTRDLTPPYLCGDLEAHNGVDMLIASLPLLDSLQTDVARDSLYLIGFSQGAAAALWALRYIEQNYAYRFHLKRCFAGSGPYDVAATYDDAVANNKTGFPMTIPTLVIGTSVAYDLNLSRDYFFTPEMNARYDDYIAAKKYKIIPIYFKMHDKKVSRWLSKEGMNKTLPETRRMYDGFMRSSIVHYPIDNSPVGRDTIVNDWIPSTPLYIFHSTTDDLVPFCNAAHIRRYLADYPDVIYDFDDYGTHVHSLNTFFSRVRKLLKGE